MLAAGENHSIHLQDSHWYPQNGQRRHYSIQLAVGIGISAPKHRKGVELRPRS